MIQVLNVYGQVVYTKKMTNVPMGVAEPIDVELRTGNYIFSVTSGSSVHAQSMVFME